MLGIVYDNRNGGEGVVDSGPGEIDAVARLAMAERQDGWGAALFSEC